MYQTARAVLARAALLAMLHPVAVVAQTTSASTTDDSGAAPALVAQATSASVSDGAGAAPATVARPAAPLSYAVSIVPAPAADSRDDRAIAVGETKTGTLTNEDPQLDEGEYYHSYSFDGRADQRVIVSLSSASFDSYLAIVRPESDWNEQNDDGTDGSNAELDVTLPATGRYLIVVTSYEGGETGDYTLSVKASDGTARSSDDGWTLYGRISGNEAELFYMDASIRRYAEGVFEVWTRWVYAGMQPASPGGDPYDHEKRLMRVSCQDQRLGMVSFVEYSGEAVVNEHTNKSVDMKPAVPGSVGESLVQQVCSR